MTPEIARYLQLTERGVVLRKSTRDMVLYGVMITLLGPVLVCLLGVLVGLATGLGEGGGDAMAVMLALVGLGMGAAFVGGLLMVALAPLRGRRSVVEVDRHAATLRRADGKTESLANVRAVALVKMTAGLDWLTLALVRHEGPPVPLIGSLHPLQRGKWDRLAAAVSSALQLPFDRAETSSVQSRGRNTTLGVLCYVPFAGVGILASLFYVNNGDPWVRFHARQSLLLAGLSIALVFAICLFGGAAMALAPQDGMVFAVGAFAGSLGLLQLTRLGLRLYACIQAYRGRAWLIPGLSRVSERWHPDSGPTRF